MSGPCYPASVIPRARELRAAAWSLRRVAQHLAVEFDLGRVPSHTTVSLWVNSAYATRVRQQRLTCWRPDAVNGGGRLGAGHHRPEFQERRARALAATGMTQQNIARAMEFDYPGQSWTYGRVQRLLGPARKKAAV